MKENKQIQYVVPTDSSLILYDGSSFLESKKRKNLYTISRVLYENVIIYSFKIPTLQASGDLSSIVEIKMYEEAGLDINKNYKISYLVKKLNFDKADLVEAYALNLDTLRESFKERIDEVKYIDFLALPFLAFTTFYTNKVLEHKNDLFVYIDDNESFMSFYKNGSYVSTKSLTSANEILDRLKTKNIYKNIDELYDLFAKQGLDQTQYAADEIEVFNAIESEFASILRKIQNVATHIRSIHEFEKIDRLFFSTKKGRIKGFKDFILKFGMSDVEVLDFNLFKERQKDNFLDKIVASYGFDKLKNNSEEQNVTIFKKEPSFLKTKAGKLISSAAVLLLVVSGIYLYLDSSISSVKKEENIINTKYVAFQNIANKYKASIKDKNTQIKKIQTAISRQDIVMENIKESIYKLENIKGHNNTYVSFLAQVNNLMQKYGLKTSRIKQKNKKFMEIDIISTNENRDKIAIFLQELIKKGFLNVTTSEIKLSGKNYISKIGIERE